MSNKDIITLNEDSAKDIISMLSKINTKGTVDTIKIFLFDCERLTIDECLTISNLLSSIKDKFEISTFKDVSLKQLIILTSVDREKRYIPVTSSVVLKSDNLSKDEIATVSKHLSQPSKSKYTVEELEKDIEDGRILDAKEVKRLKLCVKFTGEEPKRKKSKKSLKSADKKTSPSNSTTNPSKKDKVDDKSDKKVKDDNSKEPKKIIAIDKK